MTGPVNTSYQELWRVIAVHLGEDYLLDYDGIYGAAEAWVSVARSTSMTKVVEQIDSLFHDFPTGAARQAAFDTLYAFDDDDPEFDVWLKALRQRCVEALAGDDSKPLSLLDPPRED